MKKHILLVDDTRTVLMSEKMMLSPKEFDVTIAVNGQDAIDKIESKRPDLILMDIMMPVMNGIELLHRIREHRPDTEVVLITGFARTELVIEALRHGANNFVEKPFRTIELMSHLEDSFRRLDMRAENERLRERIRELEEALDERAGESPDEWY